MGKVKGKAEEEFFLTCIYIGKRYFRIKDDPSGIMRLHFLYI
jgi:hypothetical protein